MPEYLSPGVYVEEIPSGQAPIASVSTTIAGFIGQVLQPSRCARTSQSRCRTNLGLQKGC